MVIGLLVPSNDPGLDLKSKTAAASPFVIAIKHAGIKGLPSVSGCVDSWVVRQVTCCKGHQRCSPELCVVGCF
jgi:hypothetical protein